MKTSHWITALSRYVRHPMNSATLEFGNAIRDEIEFHLAERTHDYINQGLPEDEARQAASDRFGSTARVAAECHAAAVTDLVVWHRVHQLLTAGLMVAVVALCFAVGQGERVTASPSKLPPPIASMIDNDWTGDVSGFVRDDQHQPISGAQVLIVVKTWPDRSYFQRAYAVTTGRDGRFRVNDVYPTNDQYCVQIAAVAADRVLESTYHQKSGGSLEPVQFDLPTATFFAVRVTGASGQHLRDVNVFPHGRWERDGTEHSVYFDSADPITRHTNSEGLVELPYFQSGETATISVRPQGGAWELHEVTVPQLGEVVTIPIRPPSIHHSEET